MDGGKEAFEATGEVEQARYRGIAIESIGKSSAESGKVAVVAGHLMFWQDHRQTFGESVATPQDWETYTHILYPDVPVNVIARRRFSDRQRKRGHLSPERLQEWQDLEKDNLRRLCLEHRVLFSLVPWSEEIADRVAFLLKDFRVHNEEHNRQCALDCLDNAMRDLHGQPKTMLVLDADKTLAPEDTGFLFYERVRESHLWKGQAYPLAKLFKSSFGYTYDAFRQATLMYEEAGGSDEEFGGHCNEIASSVKMYPEFVSLLQYVEQQDNVGAVVVSSGIRQIWEKVLIKENLKGVAVIAGGRIADGFIVTAAVKEDVIKRLQNKHGTRVRAFGDSHLDLDMLIRANQAVVVVGEETRRSKSMEEHLRQAIEDRGLKARQVVLPSSARPRLSVDKLPLVRLTDPQFVNSIFEYGDGWRGLEFIDATNKTATKLLGTAMRDAKNSGSVLREAHRRVGWYLAVEFLGDVVGIEPQQIAHVQGRAAYGSRLFHEEETTIVALMRGGEPMAQGVSDAFPLAMFVHAKDPEDIKQHHIDGQVNVILVDSVVNTGKTVVDFVERVRALHATIRIVVVAGVVQDQCVADGGKLVNNFCRQANLTLIGLRTSTTWFVGSRETDTGNRLFNTTHLD